MSEAASQTPPFTLRRALSLNLLQNRYPALHGLRVLAIFTVLQVHVTAILKAAGLMTDLGLQTLSEMVWYGMDLFFVLSGFLIGSMLLHNEQKSTEDASPRGRAAGLWRFWKRRAFRTFPLYYLVLTALLVAPAAPPRGPGTTLLEYLYLTNYLPNVLTATMPWAWSLCVEEHFYLLVPFLVLGVSVVRRPWLRLAALGLLWLSCLAVRLALWQPRAGSWTDAELFLTFYPRTHTRYDTLVVGVALAFAQHHYEPALRRVFARWWVRLGAWAVALGCLLYLMIPPPLRPRETWCLYAWGSVTGVMYAALVLRLLNHPGVLTRLLGHRYFLYLATLGYGVYLVHLPVMAYVIAPVSRWLLVTRGWALGRVWWLSLFGLFAASQAVAYVLHLLVEKPMLAVRDRLAP